MRFFDSIKLRINNQMCRWIKYPHVHKLMNHYHVFGILYTIKSLINSNRSLSRFGDGEILWILGKNNTSFDKVSFEKDSPKLSNKLLQVLQSNDNRLEIALPGIFYNNNIYNYKTKRFYRLFMAKVGYEILPYLNINKQYYNTSISRVYSEVKNRSQYSRILFNYLKKIWNKKNILIVEGRGTRLGVGNGLFDNTLSIHRIECPIKNAFESYDKILKSTLNYLDYNKNTMVLTSLGPTATVLSYDLTKKGFRSIDIGHIDVEYEWYLLKARNKINIPTKYVNETKDNSGSKIKNIHDDKYLNEIVFQIN